MNIIPWLDVSRAALAPWHSSEAVKRSELIHGGASIVK